MADTDIHEEMLDLDDDRPLAVRRKRRMSSGSARPAAPTSTQQTGGGETQPSQPPKTPTKSKKRVRFSDPGPEISSSASSTGLTPSLKRTSFTSYVSVSTPRLLTGVAKRLSLPARLSACSPSRSISPSPAPLSGEIQFFPLRQVIDERTKRRLRRNGLSEEMNDINAQRKSVPKLEQEIQDLKDEIALVRQISREQSEGTVAESDDLERIHGPEQEILTIREDDHEQTTDVGPATVSNEDGYLEMRTFSGEGDDDAMNPMVSSSSVSEAATQASLSCPILNKSLRDARISLERIFPGEIVLGLVQDDPKELLDLMLGHLRQLKTRALVAEDSLSRSKTLEANLRVQFNSVLQQLGRARDYAQEISMGSANEKARADGLHTKVEELEASLGLANQKVEESEQDANQKQRSVEKLQDALESYRVEIGKLETLITNMEAEHNAAVAKLQSDKDEAVADLECHVVAETRGRREAEHELVEMDAKIKELESREDELKHAVNEKQQIIRETERIFAEERVGREREVGGLNVTIAQLSSELSDSNESFAKTTEKDRLLLRKLQQEREAGLRAVEAVHDELTRARDNADGLRIAYMADVQKRGAEVAEHHGLLTPVSACRFKDIEGHVEIRRGKGRKRPDSGVVILEEDEDEDMIMADDM